MNPKHKVVILFVTMMMIVPNLSHASLLSEVKSAFDTIRSMLTSAVVQSATPVTGLHMTCNADDTTAIVTWDEVPGAKQYHIRADNEANGWTGSCSNPAAGDLCTEVTEPYFTYKIPNNQTFRVWVHSESVEGAISALKAKTNLTCADNSLYEPKGQHIGGSLKVNDLTSYSAEDKLVMTHFFYWYNISPANVNNTTANFTTFPSVHPDYAEYNFSRTSVDWLEKELRDMLAAGIDVILPVYWGFPTDGHRQNNWSDGLFFTNLEEAMERLEDDGLTPPKVGMFYDNTTLERNPVVEADASLDRLDLTTSQGKYYFAHTITDFYSQLPAHRWAQVDNQPVVVLYATSFVGPYNQNVFEYADEVFATNFDGKSLYVVKDASWRNVETEATTKWGAALNGPQDQGTVVQIGPGYDETAFSTDIRPLQRVRDREDGDFYKTSWETAVAANPSIVMVETWNEYFEGTDIADSLDFGRQYIELTKQYVDEWKQGPAAGEPVLVAIGDVDSAEVFIEHLYQSILGRKSDPGGKTFWTNQLTSGKYTPERLYRFFLDSRTKSDGDFTDEEYVETIYNALLFRVADQGGKNYWVGRLENNMSRDRFFEMIFTGEEYVKQIAPTLNEL